MRASALRDQVNLEVSGSQRRQGLLGLESPSVKHIPSMLHVLSWQPQTEQIGKGLTWVVDAESQRDSTLVTVVRGVAGDGHCAVDGHLVLLTVLCYVERVWRKLKRKKGAFAFQMCQCNQEEMKTEESLGMIR